MHSFQLIYPPPHALDMAKSLQREIANGANSLEFITTEVGAMGSMDMAYEHGTSRFYNTETNEVTLQGR